MARPLNGGGVGDEAPAGKGVAAHLAADDGIAVQLAADEAGLVRGRPSTMGTGNHDTAGSKLARPARRHGGWTSTGKTGTCDDHGHDDGVRNGDGDEARKHKGQDDALGGGYGDGLGDGRMIWEEDYINKVNSAH